MCSLTLTLPNLSLSLRFVHIFKLKKSSLLSRALHKMHKYRTRKTREAEMERRRQEQRLAEKEGCRQDRLEWQKWEVGLCGQQFCFICNTPWKPGAVKDHEELCLLHPEYSLRGSMTL
ncbi:hypothetical protein DL95DRAFT_412672 [Leptodontidium sp. 2 PMI_412]|nr:hypothetical protein BKA61DRAFT_577645 [Leptodontidium sp. MPI-SDFR-AT-0119]KAH9210755.1 hypothetical protein DL95DRAFT_412672 [Leptodontidium sp. 2 PMI_412]